MVPKARLIGKIAIASMVLALLVVGVILAAAVAIDTFNAGTQDLTADPTTTSISGFVNAAGDVIGTERDTQVNWQSGAGEVKVEIDRFESNKLSFTQGSGVTGDALLQWDGSDGSMNRQYTLGADLTDSNTNDSFVLRLLANDLSTGITLKVYTDASNWSQYSLNTPGSIPDGSHVDIVIPFTSFSTGTGASGPATFSNVGAVEMVIDGTLNQGADMSLDFLETNTVRDYGDLPSGYPVTFASNGARHIPQGLRLGTNVDAEADGTNSANADYDDSDIAPDDEDGVVRTPGVNWSAGANGGSVDVTVNGCSGTCYLNGWIDWGNDGSFDEDGDQIFSDKEVSNGTQTLTFNIPTGQTFNTSFYARFRLCDAQNTCNSVTGEVTNGEVEDYKWSFGPNAVTLTRLEATSVPPRQPVGAAAAALALLASSMVVGGVLVLRRRGRLP